MTLASRQEAARSPRVLHVIGSLGGGGAERVLLTVLHGLKGCTQALALGGGGALVSLVPEGLCVFRAASERELAETMAAWQPDVVHTWLDGSLLLAVRPAAQLGIPVVHRLYNVPEMHHRYEPGAPGHQEKMAHALSAAAAVVALTPTVADEAAAFYGITRPQVIYNGFPLAGRRGSDAGRSDHISKPAGRFVILNVGRLAPQKGQCHLIRAFARIAERHATADLWIAGVGPLEEELRSLVADLGLAGRVRFVGFHENVSALHGVADLFAFPSLFEGFGNALAEALVAGLPVVASDLPVIRHDVLCNQPAAILVPPGDDQALAAAFDAILPDASRRAELRAAAQTVAASFGVARMLSAYSDLYSALAEPCRVAA